MKTRSTITVVILLALFALTPPTTVTAATALYFDTEGVDKYWSNFDSNWSSTFGGPYNSFWIDGADAHFGGTSGTVPVIGLINSVNSIIFEEDGYTLCPQGYGAITISGDGIILVNEGSATISAKLEGVGNLVKQGTGTLLLV